MNKHFLRTCIAPIYTEMERVSVLANGSDPILSPLLSFANVCAAPFSIFFSELFASVLVGGKWSLWTPFDSWNVHEIILEIFFD